MKRMAQEWTVGEMRAIKVTRVFSPERMIMGTGRAIRNL